MKNQYFGDSNDDRKYGLLRTLQSNGHGRLLVAWMLTPDDGGRDGGFRSYLQDPGTWRGAIATSSSVWLACVTQYGSRVCHSAKEGRLLPRASYRSAVVLDGRPDSDTWRNDILSASEVDLVFVDPPNGIEVPAKSVGHRASSKYRHAARNRGVVGIGLLGPDLPTLPTWASRVVRAATRAGVARPTGAPHAEALRTPHVLFLLALKSGRWCGRETQCPYFRIAGTIKSHPWAGKKPVSGLRRLSALGMGYIHPSCSRLDTRARPQHEIQSADSVELGAARTLGRTPGGCVTHFRRKRIQRLTSDVRPTSGRRPTLYEQDPTRTQGIDAWLAKAPVTISP